MQGLELERVQELAAIARSLVKQNAKAPVRVQALAWRLLYHHAEFSEKFADVLIAKAKGYDKLALEKFNAFEFDFSSVASDLERWLDFGLFVRQTRRIVIRMPFVEQ